MEKELTELIMNPVRMRIIQYLMIHPEGTAAQIGEELDDVSRASLYRNLKILLDAGARIVVNEEQIRGAVEKTYALNPAFGKDMGAQEGEQIIRQSLMMILASFERLFDRTEELDPVREIICLSSATLLLNEEEFREFVTGYGKLLEPYLNNKAGNGRLERTMTIISSPPLTQQD